MNPKPNNHNKGKAYCPECRKYFNPSELLKSQSGRKLCPNIVDGEPCGVRVRMKAVNRSWEPLRQA